MEVVVVESPTKASTLNRYLGSDYAVVASYGHVRDLPPKDGSVRPDASFAMDWEISEGAERYLRAIGEALRGAKRLYLATDPDREGEAISWHVLDELKRRGLLEGVAVKRVVFSEVTKRAVLDAMAAPRDLDDNLIDAYKARRALDYLVGFTLSPVLWRKLPGARSAGRVQSVALRLICEREVAIEAFEPREYWSIDVDLDTPRGERVAARLAALDGEKLGKFTLGDEAAATRAVAAIRAGRYRVAAVEPKRIKRSPQPPFTTSTLQQEASRKLGLAARRTMRIAQQLYEGIEVKGERQGLITYMRTDGVQIAGEAVGRIRQTIGRRYGDAYLPETPRAYRTKAKNAQEAHEAIRPTDPARTPESLAGALDKDQARLYALVWKRAVASQMASAEIDRVTADIESADGRIGLRATGSTTAFDGYLRVYREGRDDAGADGEGEDERKLPPLAAGEPMALVEAAPNQHFTEPPPRFSEASLVKRLEELGIGRPSTYAAIISVLQDRNYVRLEKRRFVPEDRGRIVTAFLENFFRRYVEYDFTASLEDQLDAVSAGRVDWRQVLADFWRDFTGAVEETRELRVKNVLDALDEALSQHLFPAGAEGDDPRTCPSCGGGRLGLKLGRHGPFIGCADYPACRYTRPLADDSGGAAEPRALGREAATGLPVVLKRGPYGFYVEREAGEAEDKPKRASLPKELAPDMVDLETALGLLSLPREIGLHPETGKPITAGIGRFGPYVLHDGTYASLPRDENVLTVGLNRAVVLIGDKKSRSARVLRELGAHPTSGEPVRVLEGRYGPYVAHRRTRAALPKETAPEAMTLESALSLLAGKGSAGKKKTTRRGKSAAAGSGGRAKGAKAKRTPARRTAARRQTDPAADAP